MPSNAGPENGLQMTDDVIKINCETCRHTQMALTELGKHAREEADKRLQMAEELLGNKNMIKTIRDQLCDKSADLAESRRHCSEHVVSITKLEEEINKLKKQNSTLHSRVQATEAKASLYQQQVQKYSKVELDKSEIDRQLGTKDKEISELKEKCTRLTTFYNNTNSTLKTTKSELSRVNEEVEKYKHQIRKHEKGEQVWRSLLSHHFDGNENRVTPDAVNNLLIGLINAKQPTSGIVDMDSMNSEIGRLRSIIESMSVEPNKDIEDQNEQLVKRSSELQQRLQRSDNKILQLTEFVQSICETSGLDKPVSDKLLGMDKVRQHLLHMRLDADELRRTQQPQSNDSTITVSQLDQLLNKYDQLSKHHEQLVQRLTNTGGQPPTSSSQSASQKT